MPEGDTIHFAANRIRPVLEGRVPDLLETPHPRFGRDRWPERLAGRAVRSVDAHGKHLFLRFEGGLTIHSHLRMSGSWRVRPSGPAPSSAWLVIRSDGQDVIQLRGPVLELMGRSIAEADSGIAIWTGRFARLPDGDLCVGFQRADTPDWGNVAARIEGTDKDSEPNAVRRAAQRVLEKCARKVAGNQGVSSFHAFTFCRK